MKEKLIKDFLKSKNFKIIDSQKDNVIAAYNIATKLVVSWVITDKFKGSHIVVIAYESSNNIRFNGKIANLQQFNMIVKAVE